jgi:hypothetical protein
MVNKKIVGLEKILRLDSIATYEIFILIGIIMVIATFLKLARVYDFSSDWFWLLAGVGLVIEGCISLVKQRRFDRKYKIIEINKK